MACVENDMVDSRFLLYSILKFILNMNSYHFYKVIVRLKSCDDFVSKGPFLLEDKLHTRGLQSIVRKLWFCWLQESKGTYLGVWIIWRWASEI